MPAPPPACPSCGIRLQAGAAVCVACGYHLAKGRRLRTSVEQLRERGREKRRRRRERSLPARAGPWVAGLLAAMTLLVVFAWGQSSPLRTDDARLALIAAAVVCWLVVLGYWIAEDGLWAIAYPEAAWLVLFGDDADPYVVAAFLTMGLATVLAILV